MSYLGGVDVVVVLTSIVGIGCIRDVFGLCAITVVAVGDVGLFVVAVFRVSDVLVVVCTVTVVVEEAALVLVVGGSVVRDVGVECSTEEGLAFGGDLGNLSVIFICFGSLLM